MAKEKVGEILAKFFSFKQKENKADTIYAIQSGQRCKSMSFTDFAIDPHEKNLYDGLRRNVPIIDAAINKIVRLAGGFSLHTENEAAQSLLDYFVMNVPVGLTGKSLGTFVDSYLDSLLTFGNAAGEMVVSPETATFCGLYNADVSRIEVNQGKNIFDRKYTYFDADGNGYNISHPELILFTALGAQNGEVYGKSILRGLPALSSVLMRIYECIGQNFDRIGNVRYSITCKGAEDGAFAKERAQQIAEQWSEGMQSAQYGEIRDFIAVGDVQIKAIGADNQIIDTEIPVKQLLEQLVAKLGIPPFLLGLSWSSTERMSAQQADILTSELEYYRRIITPAIIKIAQTYLRFNGFDDDVSVIWDNINLQDETELAQARLYNAQAMQIEQALNTNQN